MIKSILTIAALCSCAVDPTADPATDNADVPFLDGGAADFDTEPSGPIVQNRGCVGNLPTGRTITINTGDPIPSTLINEIQDAISAGLVDSFDETFFPQITTPFAGAFAFPQSSIVTDGGGSKVPGYVATGITASNSADAIVLPPIHVGYRLTAAKIMVCGNGTANAFSAALWAGPSYQSILSLGGAATQRGLVVDTSGANTWRTLSLASGGGAILPWDTTSGPIAIFPAVALSTGNGTAFGPITLTWDKL